MRHLYAPFLCIVFLAAVGCPPATAQPRRHDIQNAAEHAARLPHGSASVTASHIFATGDEDLLLLTEHKLFTVRSDTAWQTTNNVFLSDARKQSDLALRQGLSGRAATILNQTYSVFAETGLAWRRHDTYNALDSDVAYLRTGISRDWGKYITGANLQTSFVYNRGLHNNILNQGALAGYIATPRYLGARTLLLPRFSVVGILADPDDFNQLRVAGSIRLIHELSNQFRVTLGGRLFKRWYQGYFDEVLNRSREDIGGGIRLGLAWDITDSATVRLHYRATSVDSSIDFLSYTEHAIGGVLTLRAHF